jgi:hypothetical protein
LLVEHMVIAGCVVLAVAAIAYTFWVRDRDIPPPPADDPELKHLEARRQVLYENLKDLQFEYHQGKLSEEDYQSLKQGFLYDLAGVMDSIERRCASLGKAVPRTPEARPAAAGKSARGGPRSHLKQRPIAASEGSASIGTQAAENILCPQCQSPNPAGNRFCGSCGASLQPPEHS